MKKQTAVDWLVEQFAKHYAIHQLENEIEQAKKMEIREMFEFWIGGIKSFDQYYKDTFKNK
jgi:hypothetical protein